MKSRALVEDGRARLLISTRVRQPAHKEMFWQKFREACQHSFNSTLLSDGHANSMYSALLDMRSGANTIFPDASCDAAAISNNAQTAHMLKVYPTIQKQTQTIQLKIAAFEHRALRGRHSC